MSAEIQQQPAEPPAAITEVNTAVAEFDRVAAGIGALKQQYAGVVFDVTTTAGMKAACEARAAIRAPRYEVERVRKAVKAPILALGREIDARAAKITAELLAIEGPIDTHIKAEESRKEEDRKRKAEAERARVAAIQEDIEHDLRCVPAAMVGRPAAEIDVTIRDVVAIEITAERFAEFAQIASSVKESTLAKLREMHAKQLAHEAEQERLRLEREELARQRAAQEEANRKERERIAAEEAEARRGREAAEAAAAAERKRKLDEDLAKLRAERDEQERAAKAERERQRAEQERIDRERQAAQAEQRRIAEENARQAEELQRQQAELERQRQEQEAARVELERQQREAAEQLTMPAPLTNADIERIVDQHPDASIEARDFQPSADDLIALVACNYGVGPDMAAKWLRDAFAPAII